jgi:DNA-binding Lrp family transcriptional regulator
MPTPGISKVVTCRSIASIMVGRVAFERRADQVAVEEVVEVLVGGDALHDVVARCVQAPPGVAMRHPGRQFLPGDVHEAVGDGRRLRHDTAGDLHHAGPLEHDVHDLQQSGVIAGYRAVMNPTTLGLTFEVLAHIPMDREDAETVAEFERGLADIPQVRHAERLFGDPDYLVRLVTMDIDAYQQLRDTRLATLPGVQRTTSTIVMQRVVQDRPYPIG